jgi:hypothetical protein
MQFTLSDAAVHMDCTFWRRSVRGEISARIMEINCASRCHRFPIDLFVYGVGNRYIEFGLFIVLRLYVRFELRLVFHLWRKRFDTRLDQGP